MLIEIFPTAKNNYTQIALSVILLPDKCFTDIFMGAVVTGSRFLFKAGSLGWDWPSSALLWAGNLFDVWHFFLVILGIRGSSKESSFLVHAA